MIQFAGRLFAAVFVLLGTQALLTSQPAFSENPPKQIYIVQSYEVGHVCSEPQAEGELQSLAAAGWIVGRNLEVKTYYMDTYKVLYGYLQS